jgi:hypothetical protein
MAAENKTFERIDFLRELNLCFLVRLPSWLLSKNLAANPYILPQRTPNPKNKT